MKKIIVLILICCLGKDLIGQPPIKRAGPANTVEDYNLWIIRSFRPPVFQDTTEANNAITLDSCGKLLFTYDGNKLWKRQCNPKKWVEVGSGGGGSGGGIVSLGIVGNYGLTRINDSTYRVDTILIATRARLMHVADSLLTIIGAKPSGSGTTDYLARWINSTTLGIGATRDDGTNVGIGVAPGTYKLNVNGDANISGVYRIAGSRVVFLPDQANFTGTVVYGNGGTALTHSAGLEGQYNLFVGLNTGASATTASTNVLVGNQVGYNLTSGYQNTGMGHNTLFNCGSCYYNTALGYNSMGNATGAFFNAAVGASSLLGLGNGYFNAAHGVNALHEVSAGFGNSGFGTDAGYYTQANNGVFVGYKSGQNLVPGDKNISIGWRTMAVPWNVANSLNIGNGILGKNFNVTGDSTISDASVGIGIPYDSVLAVLGLSASTTSRASLRIFQGTAPTTPNSGDIWGASNHLYTSLNGVTYQLDQQVNADSVTTKWSTLGNTLTGTGKFGSLSNHGVNFVTNDVIRAALSSAGVFSTVQDATINSVVIGQGATSGLSHIKIGSTNTLRDATAGSILNTALGIDALKQTTTGDFNMAFGYTALEKNTTGSDQNGFGRQAGQNNNGDKTLFLGGAAGVNCLTCTYQIHIENSNGFGNGVGSGRDNVIIGNRIGGLSPSLKRSIVISDSTTIWLFKDSSGVTTINGGDFRYAANYAANYTARSFVDKNYVDSSLLSGSGTYTPTLTNVANVAASTAYSCQYSRVGTVVTVSGEVDIDPTTTLTLTQLGISLPIASNLTATNELGGTSADDLNTAARVAGDATNNRAEIRMTPVDVTNRRFSFTFTYRVL